MSISGGADAQAEKTAASAGKLGASMKSAAVAAGTLSAGILAAGKALGSFLDAMTDTVDQVNTLSKASGLSADTIAGLRQAARATGKELTDLVPRDLALKMQQAADGMWRATRAFDALGVSATDGEGNLRDADVVFREVIDSLGRMESETQRAALAGQLLGSNGRQMLSAFEDSSGLDAFVDQAREFGIKVGPDAVAATGKWQQATANLDLAFDDAKQTFLDLIGGAETAAEKVDDFALGFIFLSNAIGGVVGNLIALNKASMAMSRGDFVGAAVAYDQVIDFAQVLDTATDKARAFHARRAEIAGGGGDPFVGPLLPSGGGLSAGGGGAGGGGASGPTSVDLSGVRTRVVPRGVTISPGAVDLSAVVAEVIAATPSAPRGTAAYGQVAGAAGALGGGVGGLLSLAGPYGAIAGVLVDVLPELPEKLGAIPEQLAAIPEQMTALSDALPEIISSAIRDSIPELISALPNLAESLISLPGDIVIAIVDGFGELLGLGNVEKGSAGAGALGVLGSLMGGALLGPVAALAGGIGSVVRSFDTGTRHVSRTQLALIHQGEEIRNADEVSRGRGFATGGTTINVGQVVSNDPRDFIGQLQDLLGDFGEGLSLSPRVA